MSIPPSGMLFLPLSLIVFFAAPSRLGQLAIVSAVFAAAAVVNFGDASFPFGITPFFFTALLIALRYVPQLIIGGFRTSLSEPLRHHLRMVIAFIGWAVFSAMLFPFLFHNLPVDLARAGPDETYYSRIPLHWSLSNAGQAGYLLLDLMVILYLLEHIRERADLDNVSSAISGAGVIVVMVGSYQWLAHRASLPFPSGLFNSNAAWAQLANQNLGGLYRISATFDESSGAGSFLAAWVSFEFVLGTGPGRASWRHLAFALAGVVMVIATTSTTGYLTTMIMLSIIFLRCTLSPRDAERNRSLVLAGFVLIAGATVIIFTWTGQGSTLLAGVMLDKARSGSSLHRTATIVRSLDVFAGTCGLGAGLGSNRAMSIIAYIVSNLGFTGTMLFAWLMASIAAMSRAIRSKQRADNSLLILQALGMGFLARLLALSEAGAEITDPIMWLFWGVFLAAIRLEWLMRSTNPTFDVFPNAILSPPFDFRLPSPKWAVQANPEA